MRIRWGLAAYWLLVGPVGRKRVDDPVRLLRAFYSQRGLTWWRWWIGKVGPFYRWCERQGWGPGHPACKWGCEALGAVARAGRYL